MRELIGPFAYRIIFHEIRTGFDRVVCEHLTVCRSHAAVAGIERHPDRGGAPVDCVMNDSPSEVRLEC